MIPASFHASEPRELDVVIIGAGPVGLLLANLLGLAGVRTLVIEKRDEPLPSSMAIGITPPSLEILKRLDLDRVFHDAGVPVRYAEVYEAGQKLGRLDFNDIRSDYPFFLSLPQACTVTILRESLRRFPSVTVWESVECTGLAQETGAVKISLCQARTRIHFTVRAAFLVGCDGHRSTVRTALGLPVRERCYPQRFVMADCYDQSGLGSEARLFFSAEASVESFPLPGGWRRWIVLADESRVPGALPYLTDTIQRLTGYPLNQHPVRFVSEFGAKRMVVRRYYAGRVVLAGDAAHVMSSIGGQGMNTGFADVEWLAALLPRLLKDPSGLAQAFTAYDRIRRRAYHVAANRAERGMWLGTLRGRFASTLRKYFIRDILFRSPLRPRLAPHFTMLTIPFRNLSHVPSQRLVSLG